MRRLRSGTARSAAVLALILGLASAEAWAQAHSQHGSEEPKAPDAQSPPAPPADHATLGHRPSATHEEHATMAGEPREPIPALTDADRAAAFPPLDGHPVHDRVLASFVLADQLEAWESDEGGGFRWEGLGWAGGDLNRLWLHAVGERREGTTEAADLELWYGRAVARWWDLVAGVRHDFAPGPSQTFIGGGLLGLAPYKFEVEASAYLGEGGQTTARLELEYELLLTNRLILQPLLELNAFGRRDPARGIGSGLNAIEAALRLRYEFTRQFAPYVGVHYERALAGAADLRRAAGEERSDTQLVVGVRAWF